MNRSWVAGLTALVACAPTTMKLRSEDKFEGRHDDLSKPTQTSTRATIESGTDALGVRVVERDTCQVKTVERFHRIVHREKSVNRLVTGLEFAAGLIVGGAGGFALADPTAATTAVHPVAPLARDAVVNAGIGAAVVGGLALLAGIIDASPGGTTTRTLPPDHRGHRQATRHGLWRAGGRGSPARDCRWWPQRRAAPDRRGGPDLRIMGLAVDGGVRGRAAAGAGRGPCAGDATGPVLGTIELEPIRKAAIERAWATVTTARAAAAFRARFPGVRPDDVSRTIATLGDGEMDQAVGAALDAGNLPEARSRSSRSGPSSRPRPTAGPRARPPSPIVNVRPTSLRSSPTSRPRSPSPTTRPISRGRAGA